MQLRKKSKEISMEEVQEYNAAFMENPVEVHPIDEKEKELQHLEAAMVSLNTEQRLCVELFYLKEKTYAEVVEETGYEMKKVKSYIQNGKRNLMIALSKSKVSSLPIIAFLKTLYLIIYS